jgi:hypothetical protein
MMINNGPRAGILKSMLKCAVRKLLLLGKICVWILLDFFVYSEGTLLKSAVNACGHAILFLQPPKA